MAGFIIFMPATTPTIPIIPGIPEIPDSKAFLSQNFPSHPATVENRNPPPVYIPHIYSRRISGAPSRTPHPASRIPHPASRIPFSKFHKTFPAPCSHGPHKNSLPPQRQYLPDNPDHPRDPRQSPIQKLTRLLRIPVYQQRHKKEAPPTRSFFFIC